MTKDDWRARKKADTRRSIQEHALRLFLEQGYEATTVEHIASAAGVSHMTFFRYFPRKESVVESDDYDPLMVELIAARPSDEDPLTAIHRAIRAGLGAFSPEDLETILVRTRLILRTPALRARNWQAQDATRDLFAAAIQRRQPGATEFRVQVLAAAALAALTTSVSTWAQSDGAEDLVALVDTAFAALGGDAY